MEKQIIIYKHKATNRYVYMSDGYFEFTPYLTNAKLFTKPIERFENKNYYKLIGVLVVE